MAINTSFYNDIKPIAINPGLTPYEMEAQKQELISNRNKLMDAGQERSKKNMLEGLVKQSVKQDGKVDWNKYSTGAAQAGYAPEAIAGSNQATEDVNSKIDGSLKQIGYLANVFSGVYDQTSHDAAIKMAENIVPGSSANIPKDYTEENKQYILSQAKTHADKLAETRLQYQAQKDAQTQKNFETSLGHRQQNDQMNREANQVNQQRNYDQRNDAIEATRINKAKLPVQAIEKLTEAQNGLSNSERLATTFKSEFGGHTIAGDYSNTAGRMLGDKTGQAQWWQDYQTHKNKTRNQLFGGALTPTESAEYDKQDIKPNMNAEQIKANLARQAELEKVGYSRLTGNLGKAGYNVEGFAQPETANPASNDPFAGFTDEQKARYIKLHGGQ